MRTPGGSGNGTASRVPSKRPRCRAFRSQEWGARVVLVSGPTQLPAPSGVERIFVRTAEEMKKEVEARY
ncbi:MAG: phosphopantothenoylcysteine decarboxylase, partial [Myxococcota bacterium]